ncbi:MAG: transposase [Lacunisphaera sp.]
MSQRPHRARTWAPRGQTPVLTFNFNWKSLSAIAGLPLRNFYFRLHAGSIRSPQVIEFLQALHRQIPGKVLLLWDGAPIHRSKLVTAYLQTQAHWLHVERLPAYAPELNPVEYLWSYWKQHELANFCPRTSGNSATPPARRSSASAAANAGPSSSPPSSPKPNCFESIVTS